MTAWWKLGWYCKTWRPFHTTSLQIYNWQQTLHKSLRNFITYSTSNFLTNQEYWFVHPTCKRSLHLTQQRKRTAHDADDYASLPPHKKVKKTSHRVGIKADRKRKQSEIQVHVYIKAVTQFSSQWSYIWLSCNYINSSAQKSHLPWLVRMSYNTTLISQQ